MTERIFNMRVLIALAAISLIAAIAAMGQRLAIDSDSDLSLITDEFRTGGGAAVARWAQRMGWTPLPLQEPLWELGARVPHSGNVAITAGNNSWQSVGNELDTENWRQISLWVQSGNALIVMTSKIESLPDPVRELFQSIPGKPPSRFAEGGSPSSENGERQVVRLPTTWGGEVEVNESGPRLQNADDSGVLAGSSASAVLIRQPLGAGRIYLMLDDGAWTNSGLDSADNASTLAHILQDEMTKQGVLAIDHYRHGRGRVESFAAFLFSLPGAPAFCGMSLLLGLIWLFACNQRLGPAEEFRDPERRTAREYIDAVAALNQRARAASLAVESVAERVKLLLHLRGQMGSTAKALIDRAHDYAKREERPVYPAQAIELVSEIIQTRKKLHGTRTDSRAD